MNPKQKSFLDDLAALFRKYNIDYVYSAESKVVFRSNQEYLMFDWYEIKDNGCYVFSGVATSEDYTPEDSPEVYDGDEEFDD